MHDDEQMRWERITYVKRPSHVAISIQEKPKIPMKLKFLYCLISA